MEATTRSRPQRGAELELTVDALAYGGRGVARADGYVVFVQGAVPGDRVRARVTKAKRGYEARVLGFIEYDGDLPLKINNSLLSVVLHD